MGAFQPLRVNWVIQVAYASLALKIPVITGTCVDTR